MEQEILKYLQDVKCPQGNKCPMVSVTYSMMDIIKTEKIKRQKEKKYNKENKESLEEVRKTVCKIDKGIYGDKKNNVEGIIHFKDYLNDLKFIKTFRKGLFWIMVTIIPILVTALIIWMLSLYQLTGLIKDHLYKESNENIKTSQ